MKENQIRVYICGLCGRETDNIVKHHYSYFPEKIIFICQSCNNRKKIEKNHPLLNPPIEDAKLFYAHNPYLKFIDKSDKIKGKDIILNDSNLIINDDDEYDADDDVIDKSGIYIILLQKIRKEIYKLKYLDKTSMANGIYHYYEKNYKKFGWGAREIYSIFFCQEEIGILNCIDCPGHNKGCIFLNKYYEWEKLSRQIAESADKMFLKQ